MSRFVQIHTLSSYPAVLLNRDDAGIAKRLPYGGASRIRVSSQCLKRHWRKTEDTWALARLKQPMAERSRMAVELAIMRELGVLESALAEAIRVSLVRSLYGKDAARPGGKPAEEARNRQALLLGRVELDYLTRLAREAAATGSVKAAEALLAERFSRGDGKANLKALTEGAALPAGLEGALFGRMVTSDPEANTEAAIHVAHAFTVHAEESESDYFTVVDDLTREEGETGSAGLFETELTSGLFYGYVVVDGPGLIDNVGGDTALAARVVEHLLHLIATVSPGAKRGSTAPYAYADLMLVEAGDRQPRSLAGAFRKPVSLEPGDVLDAALACLSGHLQNLDRCYGGGEHRAALCTAPVTLPGTQMLNLDALAAWAGAALHEMTT
jgi:CRISPR system Cascade subunit CasC